MVDLSVVVPVFNEAGNVGELMRRTGEVLRKLGISYEIVVVDDGSSDDTFDAVKRSAAPADNVRVLRLSRNFGHQAALLAGLHVARGDAVVTMDGDLQHPPEVIPELVASWRSGNSVVHAIRQDTEESSGPFKQLTSNLFYWLFRRLSGLPVRSGMGDFRLVERRALKAVLASSETRNFLRAMFVWVGFSQGFVTYTPAPRRHGASSYSLGRMIYLGLYGLLAFSERPLYWSFWLGLLVSSLAGLYGGYALAIRVFTDTAVPGWTSVVVLMAFLLGTQFVVIGLLGAYVGAIYAEVKGRPAYVVAAEYTSDPPGAPRPE